MSEQDPSKDQVVITTENGVKTYDYVKKGGAVRTDFDDIKRPDLPGRLGPDGKMDKR